MFQKINTGLLCLAVILLAVIAWRQQPSQVGIGRFAQLGTSEEFGLDTKTGRVCLIWPEVEKGSTKSDNYNTPLCEEMH